LGSSDTGYLDSVAADATLGADMANARALRDAKAKSKRLPVRDVSTVNNALAVMYAEEHYFEDEQALARAAASYRFEDEDPSVRFSDDRRASDKDATEGAGVWTRDERRASALEALRAKQRWKQALHAHSAAAPAYVRAAPRSDLGDADKSEWIPHVFADGGGSVAWFKSRDAMTASERARADAAADRAEGKSITEKNATDAPNDARRERGEAADVERVVRVTRRAEAPPIRVEANATDSTGTAGARDISEAKERPLMGMGVRAEGRPVAAAAAAAFPSFPPGGVRAARGLPHEAPDARARVVERFVAADARGDLVDAASVDADAGRRPDADDLVVRESTTQTTTTKTRTVTMDADGNVLDERETVESNVTGDAPRTTDTVPSAAETTAEPDDAAFDALTLTEGQIDVVVDLLRENHGVDVGADELRDLLARVRTRKKYRGVESKAWQETEKGKDEEKDEGVVALVGTLLRGLLGGGDDEKKTPSPRGKCSANVVFDKPPSDPEARARFIATANAATSATSANAATASGLLARRDAKPQTSRGAWRAAKTAADLGESAVSPADAASSRDALCSASMPAAERRRILDGEPAASRAQAAKLRSSGAAQKWRAAGALGRFVAGSVDAARVAAEYRAGEEEEEARERAKERAEREAANREVLVTVRRTVLDAKGNVLETGETKGASLGHETRPRCTCFEHATAVRSGGFGTFGKSRSGSHADAAKAQAAKKKKRQCPVHFPLASGAAATKGAPSRAPAKTHAASGGGERSGGVAAARDDDAGYVLYETPGNFYLASHDHTRSKWRIARIGRRANTLEVDEHTTTHDREGLKAVMFALHKGNEASGGLRVVAQGAGVVSILELAAPGGDDPASAAGTGPDAVIARAEQLHRERAARLARRNGVESLSRGSDEKGAPREERAEARLAGGALGREKTSVLVFSGIATQSVRREGRVRVPAVGAARGNREAEMRAAIAALAPEEPERTKKKRSKLAAMAGSAPAAGDDDALALDPGESATVGLVRLRRLTIGHASSSEPERRLGLGKKKSEQRLRERKRADLKKEAEAEAARRREPEAPPSYFARARRTCAEGATAAFHLVFGKDALEEDISFTDRRRQILRDRKRPTVSELREARLHDVDMKLETQPEEIVEDGPLTEIADWFGQDWWFWNEDAEERAHKIDPARSTEEAMRRRRDPLIVKLRFRQYEEHTDAATYVDVASDAS
jgi:hypothetical protein